MKIAITFLLFVFAVYASDTYSRSIVLSSYVRYKDANTALTSDNAKYKKFANISKYAQEHNFKIVIHKSGKYFVIVAEPFFSRDSLNKALKRIKEEFKHPFVTNYLGKKKSKPLIKEKLIPKEPKEQKKAIKVDKVEPKTDPQELKKRYNKEMQEISNTTKCSWIFGCEE